MSKKVVFFRLKSKKQRHRRREQDVELYSAKGAERTPPELLGDQLHFMPMFVWGKEALTVLNNREKYRENHKNKLAELTAPKSRIVVSQQAGAAAPQEARVLFGVRAGVRGLPDAHPVGAAPGGAAGQPVPVVHLRAGEALPLRGERGVRGEQLQLAGPQVLLG